MDFFSVSQSEYRLQSLTENNLCPKLVISMNLEVNIMIDVAYETSFAVNTNNGKRSSANIVLLPTQQDAQSQAYAEIGRASCRERVLMPV